MPSSEGAEPLLADQMNLEGYDENAAELASRLKRNAGRGGS